MVDPAGTEHATKPNTRAGDADLLHSESDALLTRMCRWTARSWQVPVDAPATRADLVFALVQRLADLTADAEGRPRIGVPRLDSGVLPDQLIVMVQDLLATRSPQAHRAGLVALRGTRSALFG